MKSLEVNFEDEVKIIESFDRIAKVFKNDLILKINHSYYGIVDFEFYAYTDSDAFKDLYTHKDDNQKKFGKLYSHGSGVDITFGDGKNHGGILLRGVIKLNIDGSTTEPILCESFNGPLIVARELFSNLHSLFSSKKNEISLKDMKKFVHVKEAYQSAKILKTQRVGLSDNPKDKMNYFKKGAFRYIVAFPKTIFPKQKIKGIEKILEWKTLNNEPITKEDANLVLGYKLKTQ